MNNPTIDVMKIVAVDKNLFEHLMSRAGLKVSSNNRIIENRTRPSTYLNKLKDIAKRYGYIVSENWAYRERSDAEDEANRDAEDYERAAYNNLSPEEKEAREAEHDEFEASFPEMMHGKLPKKM